MNYLPQNLKVLRKKATKNQDEIADFLKVGRTTLSNWENGVTQPSVEEIFKIASFYGVSIDDLIGVDLSPAQVLEEKPVSRKLAKSTGKSTANSTAITVEVPKIATYNRPPKLVTVDAQGQDNIIHVPLRARAGYLAGYEDPDFIQTLPSYRLPGLTHGTFRMFDIYGHSMVPTFHESDSIIGRYVENLLEIKDDRVYIVVTHREGVVVKRVINRVQKDRKLILNSDNQRHAGEYPPIVIDPEEILEVWHGVLYMSRQMRAPGEIYNRLIDVESRLTILEDSARKLLKS